MTGEDNKPAAGSAAISDLPVDELLHYGRELGLTLHAQMGQGELLRRIRERQELLVTLDRDALLDIVVWGRRPVRASASKEDLAKEIAAIRKMRFEGLSLQGLVALARVRGLPATAVEPREEIEARLRAAEPFWDMVGRKRRVLIGALVTRLVSGSGAEEQEYRFLPEEGRPPSLKEQIAEEGLVGGIARRLRGAADDYVHEKLDEIERRIDRKLDEIDRRLAEWRDREIANRLKIIKITLVVSVLVALLSLGYSYLKRAADRKPEPAPAAPARLDDVGGADVASGVAGPDAGGSSMERLSKRVDHVIKLAHEIAREYDQEYVGTEHILLAIIREGTGQGAKILLKHGASEQKVKAEIDHLVKASLEDTWVFGRLPGTPHFKNVVAKAIEEARALGNHEVCTEHLLLGLLAEKGSVAHQALRRLGLSARLVREDFARGEAEA